MTFFPGAACLQMPIISGDIEENVRLCKELLAGTGLPAGTLVVLPELWATGFDYSRIEELAEKTPQILVRLQKLAALHGLWLAGSLPEEGGQNGPYNTMYLVGPDGESGQYRKHHLFRFWQEDKYLTAGMSPDPISSPMGPLGALVCYDLRFPEISRRQVFQGCRLIMISAQWPAARVDHWQTLVKARAIENQAFVVACNGCGTTGVLDLAGCSMIVDPAGQVLAQADTAQTVLFAGLEENDVITLRSRFCTGGERPWPGDDQQKTVDLGFLKQCLDRHRSLGSRIVFTNGCFDILHAGHVSYLEQARRCGDCLVIGLNSDRSVRSLKGDGRPVNSEQERARVLAALGCVDYVVIFDEQTPHDLITTLLPDVLVKGADWPEDQIVGAAEVKEAGGRVERIAFKHQVSTTGVIRKIRQQ